MIPNLSRSEVKDLAEKIRGLQTTVEIWPSEDADYDDVALDSFIADVVEIDGRLHFVVVDR